MNLLPEHDISMLKLSFVDKLIEHEAIPHWWTILKLWIEDSNELEWVGDFLFRVDNDEDDLLWWLIVENLLSDDDLCMLKLSCFEDAIEYEALPDWIRLFELWIKEEALLSIDCDNSLFNEKICLLLLTCEELSNELECTWVLRVDKNDDLSCRL